MTDEYTTDVDGRPVHPAVTEMAEELTALNGVYDVQINWWKSGKIQVWAKRAGVPQSVHDLIAESGWRTTHTTSRMLDGAEGWYIERIAKNFDPTAFSGAG